MTFKKILAPTFLLLALFACKDKNAQEYQAQRNQENIQKYKVIEGQYQGIVVSQNDGQKVLMAMDLTIKVQTHNDQPNNGDLGGASPVINGGLQVYDKTFIGGMNFTN